MQNRKTIHVVKIDAEGDISKGVMYGRRNLNDVCGIGYAWWSLILGASFDGRDGRAVNGMRTTNVTNGEWIVVNPIVVNSLNEFRWRHVIESSVKDDGGIRFTDLAIVKKKFYCPTLC